MLRNIFTSGKSLWHYFKLVCSGCYRRQVKNQKNQQQKTLKDLIFKDSLLEETSLISKADSKGNITYANDKFLKVAGYTLQEVVGKNHNVVNSGYHSKKMWQEMYCTVIKEKKIWHHPCVINKSKDGSLYYVKSWIQAEFDLDNKLKGFISVRHDITDLILQQNEVNKKNSYLEHAAKILRHDMHSGINTYIPRGVSSLKRRLNDEIINDLRLQSPLKMIEEGLRHTQNVYKGVYEFTNLVKPEATLSKKRHDLKVILNDYLVSTAYKDQVLINNLPKLKVNESLFCTAIDNLIKNGLKYNDSASKKVEIFYSKSTHDLFIEDNGRGLSQKDFEKLMRPYTRKKNQKESGSGLGLNICVEILKQHEFEVSCEKLPQPYSGTRFKINLGNISDYNKEMAESKNTKD
jgi:PAS domain S-box-containing protein